MLSCPTKSEYPFTVQCIKCMLVSDVAVGPPILGVKLFGGSLKAFPKLAKYTEKMEVRCLPHRQCFLAHVISQPYMQSGGQLPASCRNQLAHVCAVVHEACFLQFGWATLEQCLCLACLFALSVRKGASGTAKICKLGTWICV